MRALETDRYAVDFLRTHLSTPELEVDILEDVLSHDERIRAAVGTSTLPTKGILNGRGTAL